MWRIELLGEPRVVGYGQTISRFESKRAAALLAYLALHPKTAHPREVLADRIWPDVPFETARNRLKQTLAGLRRQLELPGMDNGSVLMADRTSIGLVSGSFELDLDLFRDAVKAGRVSEAKRLWKGEFMAGFYEDWLDPFRYEAEYLKQDLDEAEEDDSQDHPSPVFRKSVPATANSFVGREKELTQIAETLKSGRWVTLTGFGGIGKTRLSQQVGREWQEGSVTFASFVSVQEPGQLLHGILAAMNVELLPSQKPLGVLKTVVGNSPTLLILDNLEDMPAQGTAEVIEQLLSEIDSIKVLATSRTPIKSSFEFELRLDPFDVPEEELRPEDLMKNESVRLFVDRTRRSRPDFAVTETNAETVTQICRFLDGSPLSIELCAAWARLGTNALLERLTDGQEVLVSRHTLRGGRHDSPRLVFNSTCQLIAEESRTLLGKMTVFRGGFEWQQILEVCGSDTKLESLSELVEASLVRVEDRQGVTHYYLLESVRQEAERLISSEEMSRAESSFVNHILEFAESSARNECQSKFRIDGQLDWIEFWQLQTRNLRQAVKTALKLGNGDAALGIVLNTEWFWIQYISDRELPILVQSVQSPWSELLKLSHFPEGVSVEAAQEKFEALADTNDLKLRGESYVRLAKLAITRQHMDGVRSWSEEALRCFKDIDDSTGVGICEHILYNCSIQEGDRTKCNDHRKNSESAFEATGNKIHLAAVAYTQARELYMRKDFGGSLSALYRCRDLSHGLQNMRFLGRVANLFGVDYKNLGDPIHERLYLYLSLLCNERIHDLRAALFPLWNLFLSLGSDSKFELALPIMGYTVKYWDEIIGEAYDETDQALFDDFELRAKQSISIGRSIYLRSKGESMNLKEMVEFVGVCISDELLENLSEAREFFGSDKSFEPNFQFLTMALR